MDIKDIHSPADIKNLSLEELTDVAEQLRAALMKKLSAHGGHVGPNLGMVEATIALHYVFNAPTDKLIFDVSHQTYVHKMLTGRIEAFLDPAHYDDVTGFTEPSESEYDLFAIGHTSTSLALASGMAKARDLMGGKENVVAIIGDGSLSGGEAFEGLDYASTLGTNFIVIVNDNNMSIAENHGGLYADLRLLRNTNGTGEPNFFRSLGYSYRYVRYGNDLRSLIEAFSAVKDIDHPVVVHINTMKGMGLPVAEKDKETFHFHAPFDLKTGQSFGNGDNAIDYTDIFSRHMLEMMQADPKVVTLTAGTPGAIGFTPDKRKLAGKQFVDVGIAEEQATGMSSGLAKAGATPVFGVVSTFLQRAYDQMSQDVCINNSPATFVVFYGGIYGMNDVTHLGFFDIAIFSNIPNLVYLSPVYQEEYTAMINWAITQKAHPVIIRTPGGAPLPKGGKVRIDYTDCRYEIIESGSDIALIGAGDFFPRAEQATQLLKAKGYNPTLINPLILSSLDKECLDTLKNYKVVITLEDGIIEGGFGEKIASYLGKSPVKVINLGLPKEFLDRYNIATLVKECHLEPEQIAQLAEDALK